MVFITRPSFGLNLDYTSKTENKTKIKDALNLNHIYEI